MSFICSKCGERYTEDFCPDYVADPRLVIREMEKKGLRKRFLSSIGTTTNLDALGKMSSLIAIDTTGQLAQLALDWLRKEE